MCLTPLHFPLSLAFSWAGLDRDEYPPAMSLEGESCASVRHISLSDNRGSGAKISHQLREYPNGTKYKIILED